MLFKRYPLVIGAPGGSGVADGVPWDDSLSDAFPLAGTSAASDEGFGVNFTPAFSARSRRIPSRSEALSPNSSTKYFVVVSSKLRPLDFLLMRLRSARAWTCSYTFEPIMSPRSDWRIG